MSDEMEVDTMTEGPQEETNYDIDDTTTSEVNVSSEPERIRKNHTNWFYVKPHHNRLYNKIIKNRSLDNVIQSWIEQYTTNREMAIMKLLQLFIDLCNFQNLHIQDYLEFNEIFEITKYMESMSDSDFAKSDYRYLYKYRSKEILRYQKKIDTFILFLIRQCKENNIIYDNYMINYCVRLLKLLSDSDFRGIRHTGVYIALKFISGLVIIVRDLYNEGILIKRDMRDYKNQSGDSDTDESENLQIRLISLEDKYKNLLKPTHFLYENVFKKNWNLRDKHLYLMRCDCINEARQWIKYFPEKFLSNDLLQIILDAVTDPHKSVRLTSLQLFMYVIDNISHKEKLKTMIKKIIIVVCGRVLDVDINISVYAVDLLCLIDRTHRTLSSDLQKRIMLKIYCPYYNLGCAAGRYLAQKILSSSSNDKEALKKLVKYHALCEKEHNINGLRPLLVEATIDSLPVLSNITSYINLFIENELDELEKDILSDILYDYLKILSEGTSTRNKTKRKIDYVKIQNIMKEITENITDLTAHYPEDKLTKIFKLFLKINKKYQEYKTSLNRTET